MESRYTSVRMHMNQGAIGDVQVIDDLFLKSMPIPLMSSLKVKIGHLTDGKFAVEYVLRGNQELCGDLKKGDPATVYVEVKEKNGFIQLANIDLKDIEKCDGESLTFSQLVNIRTPVRKRPTNESTTTPVKKHMKCD
ncbi:hypothetical protein M3Y95_00327400 [Aphelenchoides besseyi]|nr:hypothetical protein M3Y95_00327400 [Aphelenchoides besseyi]